MIILKDLGGKLPLIPRITKVVLNNPNLVVNYNNEKKYLPNILTEKIDKIIADNVFEHVPKKLRHKDAYLKCTCWIHYNSFLAFNFPRLKKLFHTNH